MARIGFVGIFPSRSLQPRFAKRPSNWRVDAKCVRANEAQLSLSIKFDDVVGVELNEALRNEVSQGTISTRVKLHEN